MGKTIYSDRRKFLSAKLIEAREKAGFTQKEVSDTGLISQSELSKIETGQRRVEFLILLDLATFYSVPIDFFIPLKK